MTMNEERGAMDAVSDTLARIREDGRNAVLTLKNGIVLRCKAVPPLYLQALNERYIPPPPPMVTVHNDGAEPWDEENPSDPVYLRDIDRLFREHATAVTNLMLGMGTEMVSVPKGYFRPEEDGWIEAVKRAEKFTGVEIPINVDDADMRYISWLRFYAADNNADVAMLGILPQQLAGVSEEEVSDAMAAFRGLQERRANRGTPPVEPHTNGDTANRATRRANPRARGT